MEVMGLGAALLPEIFSGNISPFWIPIVGCLTGAILGLGITAMVIHHRQQMQRLDYELHLRKMDHERRMKELELELAKMRESRSAGTPA